MTEYLGVLFERRDDGTFVLSQRQYLLNVLRRFGMDECKPCATPCVPKKMLKTIAGGAAGPTASSPVLLSSFPTQMAVCRITLKTRRMGSRHARWDERHIDGQGLSANHHEKCPNICPTIFYYVRALDRCYQYTAL
jgi:hypothetical protein